MFRVRNILRAFNRDHAPSLRQRQADQQEAVDRFMHTLEVQETEEPQPPVSDGQETAWTCPVCTYCNEPQVGKCAMCNTKRSRHGSQQDPISIDSDEEVQEPVVVVAGAAAATDAMAEDSEEEGRKPSTDWN